MGLKRKQPPKSTQSAQLEEPPLKHPHQQPQFDLEAAYGVVEEEVEVEEEEEEEQEEVEQQEGQEEEEEDDDDDEDKDNNNNNPDHAQNNANDQTAKAPSTSSSGDAAEGDDGDEEPIQKLLEPFGKDQIANLLCEAASKHRDVADGIRRVADADPTHRKIFVHGLGWDTTAETLTAAFRQYGEIEDCKAVSDKISGKSKGYGFILFKTRRGAREALRQPQKKIGNRMTACQLASVGPVTNAPSPQAQPSAPAAPEHTQRKIYVSNVSADLDPQRLLAFFSRFGEIEEGPLGLDKFTGKPKGFCLFVYKSVESAKRVLEESHKQFEGHVLHCQKAIDGPKLAKSQQQHYHNSSQRTTTTATPFQRNDNTGFVGGTAAAPGHLMAPAVPAVGYNQGAAAAQTLNPALGQALTALLASQGAGLGLNGLLGTMGLSAGVNPPGVPAAGYGMQGGYNTQGNVNPGVFGGYGSQVGLQSAYPNQQVGQGGGSGRGQQQQQHVVGQYGGVVPYMGH